MHISLILATKKDYYIVVIDFDALAVGINNWITCYCNLFVREIVRKRTCSEQFNFSSVRMSRILASGNKHTHQAEKKNECRPIIDQIDLFVIAKNLKKSTTQVFVVIL